MKHVFYKYQLKDNLIIFLQLLSLGTISSQSTGFFIKSDGHTKVINTSDNKTFTIDSNILLNEQLRLTKEINKKWIAYSKSLSTVCNEKADTQDFIKSTLISTNYVNEILLYVNGNINPQKSYIYNNGDIVQVKIKNKNLSTLREKRKYVINQLSEWKDSQLLVSHILHLILQNKPENNQEIMNLLRCEIPVQNSVTNKITLPSCNTNKINIDKAIFNNLIKLYFLDSILNVGNHNSTQWTDTFFIFSGKVYNSQLQNNTVLLTYEVVDNAPKIIGEGLNKKGLLHENDSIFIAIYNVPGNQNAKIETNRVKGNTESVFASSVSSVPGLSKTLEIIGNIVIPVFSSNPIEPYRNLTKRDTNLSEVNEKSLEFNKKKTPAKDKISCNCDTLITLKINSISYKILIPCSMNKLTGKDCYYFNNCDLQQLFFAEHWYQTIKNNKTELNPIILKTGKPLYTSIQKGTRLDGFAGDSVIIKYKTDSSVHSLQKQLVDKYYPLTFGIGYSFQFGHPYELNYQNGSYTKNYQNRIILTGGLKYYPGGASMKKKLCQPGIQSGYKTPFSNSWFAHSFYILGGFTLSSKPYEQLFLGMGIDIIPGLSLSVQHRWNYESKVKTINGQLTQVKGYSTFGAPGSLGISLLFDPSSIINSLIK